METTISATELARHLADVLSRVQYRGERFLIERNGSLAAAMMPPATRPSITLKDLAVLMGDQEPDAAFADDLEALQDSQPLAPPSPWPN